MSVTKRPAAARHLSAGKSVSGFGRARAPQGMLRPQGTNTIALAVWADDAATAGLGTVDLAVLGNTATSLRARSLRSPG